MKAEIIAVGTELLLGQIVNSNAQQMSEMLADVGIDVLFHTTVGDNEMRIASAISEALNRVDVVIITGGLGPTHDDLTREAIARATGRPLEHKEDLERALRERFEAMGRVMAPENVKQAQQPSGAVPLMNPNGTAPGVLLELGPKLILAIPGVPHEMRAMMQADVIPNITSRMGEELAVLTSRVLKVAGMGESDVANRLSPVIAGLDRAPGPTIALLASAGEVRVRITAKAASEKEANLAMQPVASEVRQVLGAAVFGEDDDTLEGTVAGLLADKGLLLAVAESVTGGMVTARLVNVPGASKFLKAGYVAYSAESKVKDLAVPPALIEAHGTVAVETVVAMAEGARTRASADLAVATVGEAGPSANASVPIGTVHVALSHPDGALHRSFVAPGPRMTIRSWASLAALNLLRLWLLGEAR